jgi:alkanesulfonate monooxygenase SsuD/methylene tetrahydromethanopterin reductase-like flavin-dependent oxidoreductase (luciferase family)
MIKPLPCKTPIEELGASLLIGTSQEVIDKLVPYAELGIDRVILNLNFGLEASETLDAIEQFAQDVMPHFSSQPTLAA